MESQETNGNNSNASEIPINTNHTNHTNNAIKLVKAIYPFKGSNNDELCFNKDDIITLTQTPSGGWFEGTLNGMTGWFPSNYCQSLTEDQLISNDSNAIIANDLDKLVLANNTDSDIQQYRNMVFQDIEDTESAFVRDLVETINKYLKPLQQSQIFPENEINSIIRIVQDMSSVHKKFLSTLDSLNSVAYKDSRIGGVFLDFAPQIKAIHFEYCANHSKFVYLIEKYKKEICNLFVATNASDLTVGSVQLTTCLSSSFRRIDKYPALLQELQRYTDESHIDRGDTQRAGFVYRELSMSCLELRRQKEMELEVMLGNIKNWEGMSIQSFGEIIRMDSVSIQIVPDYSEMKKDRYLVLFPQILLVLSVSNEMSSFLYEAKIRLEDAVIKIADELVDKTNIFEISCIEDKSNPNANNSFIIQCPTIEDANHWIELLHKYILHSQTLKQNTNLRPNTAADSMRSTIPSNNSDRSSGSNIILNTTPQRIGSTRSMSRYWSNRSLIPQPPTRVLPNGSENKEKQLTNSDDVLILQVIESYCSKNRIRQTSNSVSSDNPQVLVVEERLQSEESKTCLPSDDIFVENDVSIREELKLIKMEMKSLSEALKAERRARKKLKAFIIERKSPKNQF